MNKIMENSGFNKFFKISAGYYETIGLEPYNINLNKKTTYLSIIILFIGFGNLIICLILETVYLIKAFSSFSNFLNVTTVISCLGFCLVSICKIFAMYLNKKSLSYVVQELYDIYPNNNRKRLLYNCDKEEKYAYIITKWYGYISMIFIWSFNFTSLLESIYEYLFNDKEFIPVLPYFLWYPFDYLKISNLYLLLLYIQQIYAGYVAAVGTIAPDMLLYSCVMLICMYFNYIKNEIENYEPKGDETDIIWLKKIIKYHVKMMRLTANINDVFSLAILFNVMTATVIACVVGLQLTTTIEPLQIYKWILGFIITLLQIFLICYVGNKFIDTSTALSDAAYSQKWYNGNKEYRKNLLYFMHISQKPCVLNASSLVIISLGTFATYLKTAYKFFALVRTLYNNAFEK